MKKILRQTGVSSNHNIGFFLVLVLVLVLVLELVSRFQYRGQVRGRARFKYAVLGLI
ncbi:hypothetical protein D1AOALGA4SA_8741 [Olavius algarvensis Delta 1 endosymbiont]|nr:hypothetical protein D1AOALGA4SA_8741 [Olavius algarvensis Delta 1 endosymbiont]